MKAITRPLLRAALAATLFLAGAAQAQEAGYPSRPIKIIIGLSPGGSTDFLAREIAKGLGERLKVPVIIENKPGANTIIATTAVAKSAPDGYTLLMTNSMNTTNPWVYEKLPYDYRKDLRHIALIGNAPNLFVGSSKLGVSNLRELVAYAKKNPGKLSYGSAGIGSVHHLLMEIVALRAGIEVNHIPYKGGGPAIQDVLGGNLDTYFGTMASTRSFVQRGDMRAIFATTGKRSPFMPEVETLEENGLKGLESGYWLGLSGPAGLPDAVVARLNKEINELLKTAPVMERLDKGMIDPMGGTPADMEKFFERELQFWKEAAVAAKVKPMAVQ